MENKIDCVLRARKECDADDDVCIKTRCSWQKFKYGKSSLKTFSQLSSGSSRESDNRVWDTRDDDHQKMNDYYKECYDAGTGAHEDCEM